MVHWHRSTALECGLWCAWFAFLHITSPVESRCLQQGRSLASAAFNFESTGHQSFLSCFCPAQTVLLIARLVHPVSGTWRVPGLEDDTRVLQLADLPKWINTLGIGWLSADFPFGPEDADAVLTSGGTWPCRSQCGSPSYTPSTPPRWFLPVGLRCKLPPRPISIAGFILRRLFVPLRRDASDSTLRCSFLPHFRHRHSNRGRRWT